MCLDVNKEKTEQFKQDLKDNKKTRVTLYKVLNNNNTTCYIEKPVTPGWLVAEGTLDDHQITYGAIHAYLDITTPKVHWNLRDRKIVKCYGWIEDLVALGINDICFTKVYFPNLNDCR